MAIATDINMQQLFHVARFFMVFFSTFPCLLPEGEGKMAFFSNLPGKYQTT
jgi:hypothetical protein